MLSSTFGIASLVGYFPGGWLADRFSSRKLICIALLIISASGFVFATIPSFEICLVLYGLWGLAIALAVLVWFYLKDELRPDENVRDDRPAVSVAQVMEVLRLPIVWLLAIIIMAAYSGYWGSFYFTPYATTVLGLGDVVGGAVGLSKYWIAPVAAIAAGLVADKIGTAKAVVGLFILMTSGFLIFGLLPGSPVLVPLLLVNVAVVSIAVFALRCAASISLLWRKVASLWLSPGPQLALFP